MADAQIKALACQKYVRFLVHSYLQWSHLSDLNDVSCVVRFNKPTLVGERAFYPQDFMDILSVQFLTSIETEFGCTAAGWHPHTRFGILPAGDAMEMQVWFTQVPRVVPHA